MHRAGRRLGRDGTRALCTARGARRARVTVRTRAFLTRLCCFCLRRSPPACACACASSLAGVGGRRASAPGALAAPQFRWYAAARECNARLCVPSATARRAPAPPVAHDVSACTLFHARAVLPLPRGGRHSRALSRLHMRAPGDDEKPIDVEVAKDELRKASASKVCVRALRRDRAPAPPALLQQWTAGKQHAPPSNSAPCAHARVHTQHHAQRVESVFDVEGLQAGYRFSQSFGPCLELTHILYIYCLSFSQSFGPCL